MTKVEKQKELEEKMPAGMETTYQKLLAYKKLRACGNKGQ